MALGKQPRDVNGVPWHNLISTVALAETVDTSINASTPLALNASTQIIEVTSLTKSLFLKWGGTVSSSDFDGFVPLDTSKIFVVPEGQTTVEFIEESATAKLIVLEY